MPKNVIVSLYDDDEETNLIKPPKKNTMFEDSDKNINVYTLLSNGFPKDEVYDYVKDWLQRRY